MPQSRLVSFFALALASANAHSLGIGEVVSQPRLGERLRIEVRLLADSQTPIDTACIQLAPGDNGDDLPWVRGARLRLQRGPQPTLVIESNETISHPIYLLGLRLSCGAEVKREFTLMPQAPIEMAAASPTQRHSSPIAFQEPAGALGDDARSGSWTTLEGETLAGIASALYPNDPANQRRFIRQAARANSRLFRGVADPAQHPLPAGESLALQNVGSRQVDQPARKERVARSSPPRQSPPSRAIRAADTSVTAVPKSTQSPPRGEDRLSVASSGESESGLRFSTLLDDARSRGLTEEQRERLRQEQRLIAELDEKIIASLALSEKIRNMEGYLEKLQGDMVQLDQKIQSTRGATASSTTGAQAAPPAAPSAPKVETKGAAPPSAEAWWPWLFALLAVLAAAAGWFWWRRRRPDETVYAESDEADDAKQEPVFEPVPEQTVTVAATPQWAQAPDSLAIDLEDHHDQENRIGVAEHDSALELAEIMLSFGRVQGAAQTLTDYVNTNPRQAIRPWLRLFEIYHDAGMRAEFESLVEQFHRNFNVQKITWDEYPHDLARASLEDLPHVVQEVLSSWGTPACLQLLRGHLHDNREGTRMGFPLGVVDDIATLIALLEARLEARAAEPVQATAV